MRGPERGKASKEEGVTFLSEPESEQKGGGANIASGSESVVWWQTL